jgi:hypothetical protein
MVNFLTIVQVLKRIAIIHLQVVTSRVMELMVVMLQVTMGQMPHIGMPGILQKVVLMVPTLTY